LPAERPRPIKVKGKAAARPDRPARADEGGR
jgi:hypothetical protein